jgi:hypothetical protein
MDFKRVVVLFVFCFIFFSSCNKQNNTEPKITVFQSCEINDNILLVKLKNSHDKPIGEINYMEIYKGFIPDEVIYDENEVLIKEDLTWANFHFNNEEECKIYIRWFGGSLTVNAVYIDKKFRAINERYKK